MRAIKKAAVALVLFLIVGQFIPVSRTNPPVESDVQAPADVKQILRRACYDCHSNETVWPWYSRVAPASWLVARDVNEGREHLNFSTWGRLSAADRSEAFEHIEHEVAEGAMPLPIYLPAHPEARLTDQDKAALETWARANR